MKRTQKSRVCSLNPPKSEFFCDRLRVPHPSPCSCLWLTTRKFALVSSLLHLPLSTNLMLHTPYLYAWLLSCLWWGRPRVLSPAYSNSRIPGNILCRMKRTQKSRVCSLNPPKSEFFCDRLRVPHPSPCSCLWLTTRKFALVSSLLHLPLSTNLMLHTPYLYAWLLSCLWWGRPRVLSPAYSNSRIPGNILCRMKRTQKSRVCSLNPPKSEFFCDRLRVPHPSPCSCLWLTTRKFALVSSLLHLPLSTNLMLHTPYLYAWLLSCLWWGRPRVLSPAYSNSRIPGNILRRMKRTQKSRVCSLNPPKSEFFCDRLRVPHPSPCSCLWLTTRKFALVSSLLHLPLSTNLMLHTPYLYAWLLSCLWWGRPRVLSPAYSNSRIPGNILCRMKRTQKSKTNLILGFCLWLTTRKFALVSSLLHLPLSTNLMLHTPYLYAWLLSCLWWRPRVLSPAYSNSRIPGNILP